MIMAKNDLAKRQAERTVMLIEAGEDIGFQKAMDYWQMVLHDPRVMGKHTIGEKRMQKLTAAVMAKDKEYCLAYSNHKEADYYQEKMDEELQAIYKDKITPFNERQPHIRQYGYEKARKGWK